MIHATSLTPEQFAEQYPRGGSTGKTRGNRSKNDINAGSESPGIINDIPTMATSTLVYKTRTLRTYRGDETYPIPQGDEFQQLRQLKSLEAVVKEISPGESVFSHMWVSPDDVAAIFGNEFKAELEKIQKDVSRTRG